MSYLPFLGIALFWGLPTPFSGGRPLQLSWRGGVVLSILGGDVLSILGGGGWEREARDGVALSNPRRTTSQQEDKRGRPPHPSMEWTPPENGKGDH